MKQSAYNTRAWVYIYTLQTDKYIYKFFKIIIQKYAVLKLHFDHIRKVFLTDFNL